MPQTAANPVWLIAGAPSRRQARLLVHVAAASSEYRIISGRFDADLIAAVARCVDAFAVPARRHNDAGHAMDESTLALAMGGVPVVTNGRENQRVLAHERSAFVVDPGDERGFISTLDQVLALPAAQRHLLGEEFARSTLAQWTWESVAETYAGRFAALVGRPRIPAGLRAA